MDRKSTSGRIALLAFTGLVFCAPFELAAQVPVDEYGRAIEPLEGDYFELEQDSQSEPGAKLTDTELEELVGPIALYPDDLLAIVLPASTYPLEIVQAARFLDELAKDSSLEPDESWDESVVALLNYPEVVYLMDKEIDWTWRLGEAVINQQADVLAAVENFRERAYAAGNLESDERQTVSNEDGVIEIEPVDEEIIYVPYYEPEEVVVYQPRRVYYYYPYAYPVYYYPYPAGYSFASGYFWGVTTAFTIDWHNHYLHVYHPSYWGHPYYGHYYYGNYYRQPSISVFNYWYVNSSYRTSPHRYRDGDYWRPRRHHSGARPATQTVHNYYYSAGDGDSGRTGTRSGERTRQHLGQRARTDVTANNQTRTRAARTTNRSRQNRSNNRIRTGIVDGSANRVARTDNRQRTGSNANRARSNRDVANTVNRQRLTASNARQTVQRSAPPRSTTATRTRTATRQAVRQQAPVQRQASPPAVQRPAAQQRQATRPAAQRQSTARAPANRGQGRGRQHQQH